MHIRKIPAQIQSGLSSAYEHEMDTLQELRVRAASSTSTSTCLLCSQHSGSDNLLCPAVCLAAPKGRGCNVFLGKQVQESQCMLQPSSKAAELADAL